MPDLVVCLFGFDNVHTVPSLNSMLDTVMYDNYT